MTAGSARIAVLWAAKARADLRAIERETALQILYCMDRYLTSRSGDVKKLRPPLEELCRNIVVVFQSLRDCTEAG